MKNLPFLLALALLAGAARPVAAQNTLTVPLLPTDSLARRIPFQGVVPVPGVPAAELQARAREWVAITFADARQVIQLDDAARGVLIGRGFTENWVDHVLHTQRLSFAFRLDFREGRYRYEVFELGSLSPIVSWGKELSTISNQLSQITMNLDNTGTVAANSRYTLFVPDTDPTHRARSEKPTSSFSQERAAFAESLQRTIGGLLQSLQQHATAAPKKW